VNGVTYDLDLSARPGKVSVRLFTGGGNDRVEIRLSAAEFQRFGFDRAWTFRVTTGGGDDTIIGGGGNEELNAGDGNDVLYGNGGNDLLWGGTGADRLFGGDGNDELYTVIAVEGTRPDGTWGQLYSAADDLLDDGDGADTLNGVAEEDEIPSVGPMTPEQYEAFVAAQPNVHVAASAVPSWSLSNDDDEDDQPALGVSLIP
jgi:Ca2+-binding RTX toxin-like protein